MFLFISYAFCAPKMYTKIVKMTKVVHVKQRCIIKKWKKSLDVKTLWLFRYMIKKYSTIKIKKNYDL